MAVAYGHDWHSNVNHRDGFLVTSFNCCTGLSFMGWYNRFFFPDSPTTAWFLTPEERAKAVLRIKENQTGVENKVFKKEQSVVYYLSP